VPAAIGTTLAARKMRGCCHDVEASARVEVSRLSAFHRGRVAGDDLVVLRMIGRESIDVWLRQGP